MKKTLIFALLSSSIFSINAMAENADRIVDKALLNQEPTQEVMTSTTGQEIKLSRSIDANGVVTTTTTDVAPTSVNKEVKPTLAPKAKSDSVSLNLNNDKTTFEAHPVHYVVDGKSYDAPSLVDAKDLLQVNLKLTHHQEKTGFFSFFHPRVTDKTQELNAQSVNGFAVMGGETTETAYIKSTSVNKDTQEVTMEPGVVQDGFQYFFLPTLANDKQSVNLRYKLNFSNLNSIATVSADNGLAVQTPNTQENIAQGLMNVKLDTPTTLLKQGDYDMVVTVHNLK